MANIGVNSLTGQVAIAQEGGGPQQSNVRIYQPGQYKINLQTRQIAIPSPDGHDQIYDLSPEKMSALSSPEAILARKTGGVGAISQGQPNPGQGESALRGLVQGVSLGTADELGGASGALARLGDPMPIDPAHPVTGGMSGGFGANYLNAVGQERDLNRAAKESNPKSYKGAFYAGALLPAFAMPANTLRQAAANGGLQGGMLGGGLADTQDPKKLLISGGLGAGGGALLGAGVRGLQSLAFDTLSPSGLAYNALSGSAPSVDAAGNTVGRDIGNIPVRPSSAPAELDPGMANLLRNAGQMNGDAAAAAIPGARARMGDVNQAIIQRVGTDLSPLDAETHRQDIIHAAQIANQHNYQGRAYLSPARVGLPHDLTSRPSFQEALTAARAAAADENPPRNIDVTNLGAQDIDLIDRMLNNAQTAATQSVGDISPAAQVARARIPTRGEQAGQVRQAADANFPELTQARDVAHQAFGLRDAIDMGQTWFGSGKSAEQVGREYNALTPDQQQAALAGFATDIRNTLGTKTARANLGQVFEKTGLADKLRNVGMPDDVINNIVRGGAGARDVLNALEDGSMTARNISGKEALQSSASGIKSGDLIAGGVLKSKTLMMALPVLRHLGARAQRDAAALIVNALTQPGGAALASIINHAPQTWGGLLNAAPRTTGSLLGAKLGGAGL